MRSTFLPLCLSVTFLGCGETSRDSGFDSNPGSSSSSGGSSSSSGGLLGTGQGTDGGATDDTGCSKEAGYVYVLDVQGKLLRFDPPSLAFTPIAPLSCAGGTYSMAVDRDAFAWVLMQSGQIVKVDTRNGDCKPTTFAAGQSGFATTFGMGFSSNGAGSKEETLFLSSATSATLAKLDTTSLSLTSVAPYDKLQARVELTGTGDGRLFGAFEGSPYVVAEIDKATAKILSQAPQSAIKYKPASSNFAFAFWGGDFYLFVGPGGATDVFKYSPADGTTLKVSSVAFEIVGAGVSTCAPLSLPK